MAYGPLLNPQSIPSKLSIAELVDNFCLAYNAGRLREACQLLAHKVLRPGVTVGLTLSGALTPAGLGYAALVPLIEAGFIDWMVSTGANLYHDMHRSLGLQLYQGSPFVNDVALFKEKIIRIYDILMDQDVLFQTDAFLYRCLEQPEFQHRMSTAELHYRLGRYTLERERVLNYPYRSLLSAAHLAGVPIYTPSPGDSTIGMNIAAIRAADGYQVGFDPEADVMETTAIVYQAKQNHGKSAVIVLGGGSPKNFALQTEPQLQEVLGLEEKGHDYFIQFTDARPDTGGLSGATPQEAVTWGKVDPSQLPDSVVCYVDTTIALPLLTAYVLEKCEHRPFQRLYDQRSHMVDNLVSVYKEKWTTVKPKYFPETE
ncbi:homospermidine biosynthesis protein [Ktedonospora formicarum]|uniref:Deoxyhypusine synthase n=1 Tax=Ktedonospora formicarum TaxID=2778364 RepID=A0A8J3I194_9CHLR|nr:deoxyhypusine synthase [Ktedonospora formicarum]GHO46941.1 deoxyhypusine synthase [Ktedonospora formicarum]